MRLSHLEADIVEADIVEAAEAEAEAASTSGSDSGSGSASGLPARLPKPYLRLSTLDLSQGGRFAEGSGKRREIWPRGRFGLIFWAHFLGSSILEQI